MTTIKSSEAELRVVRRADHQGCSEAFIDCRLPGSMPKYNYAFIGGGVSQSNKQVINLQEAHGFNVGGAAMPNGITNNLHLHFTAEVFMCFSGEWTFRWGVDGQEGEFTMGEGGILTVPTWIYRGFTNTGADDGFLFTCLGQDKTGGVIWSPDVIKRARETGLALSAADTKLVDLNALGSEPMPDLLQPMPQEDIDQLKHWSPEEMRARITLEEDLVWSNRPTLDSVLPGGRKKLASVIGYGLTEDRDQQPRVFNPHGFSMAWLEAGPGEGMLTHRHYDSQVFLVRHGEWKVEFNDEGDVTTTLGEWDLVSVPAGAWRSLKNVGTTTGRVLVVTGSDARTRLEWAPNIVKLAEASGYALDPNGYVASTSTIALRAR